MRRNRNRRNSFSYGTLEPKRLLAGNVSANVDGEHIYIRGDQQDNQIRIFPSNGKITIQGLNGTTINRGNAVTVNNSFTAEGGRIGSEFAGGLRVHMGPGNDSIDVSGIRLNQRSIIYGGTGNDNVIVRATDVIDTAVIQTFDGDDDVTISNVVVTDTLWALTLDGADRLSVTGSDLRGSAIMATGNGDDFLQLNSNTHLGVPQFVLTQDGDDTVEIQTPTVGTGSLEIYTGNGDDQVSGQIASGQIDGRVIVAGQGGVNDTAELEVGGSFTDRVFVRGFEFTGEVVFQNAQSVDYGFAVFDKGGEDSFFVADFVQFQKNTRLSSIEWRGSYENSAASFTDSFVIEIYNSGTVNDPAIGEYQAPVGEPRATYNIGNNVTRVDTGLEWSNAGSPSRRIFNFEADIDFQFIGNNQYWISIYAAPAAGPDFDNDFYILAEDVEFELEDPFNGAANVKWPNFPSWYPNTSAKLNFTLRS